MSQAQTTDTENKTSIADSGIGAVIGEEEYMPSASSGDISKMMSGDSPPLNPDNVIALQRQLGNQATINIVNRSRLSRKMSDAQPFANLKMVTPDAIQRDPKDDEDGDVVVVNEQNIDDKVEFQVNASPQTTDDDTPQGEADIELDADEADDSSVDVALDQVEGAIKEAQGGGTTATPDGEISDEDEDDDFDTDTTTGGDDIAAPADPNAPPDLATIKAASQPDPTPKGDNPPPDAAMIKAASQPDSTPIGPDNLASNKENAVPATVSDTEKFEKLLAVVQQPIPSDVIDAQIAFNKTQKNKKSKKLAPEAKYILNTLSEIEQLSLNEKQRRQFVKAIQSNNWSRIYLGGKYLRATTLAKSIPYLDPKRRVGRDVIQAAGKGETYANAAVEVSAGFTAAEAAKFVEDLSDGVQDTSYWDFAVDTLIGILGKIVSVITIGVGLYRLATTLFQRNLGFFKGMTKAGFTADTDPDVEEEKAQTDDEQKRVARGRVAQFGYKKSRKAVVNVTVRLVSTIISWLMGFITLITGGAAAVPAGIIAAAANVTNMMRVIINKGRGLIKFFSGTRGVKRQQNADELLQMAIAGDQDAIDIIWDVNPFDYFKVVSKGTINIGKHLFGQKPITILIRPSSKQDFAAQLTGNKKGIYSTQPGRVALRNALKGVMASVA